MSAFPPIATEQQTSREVRFVPITDVTKYDASLDVGTKKAPDDAGAFKSISNDD
jgi:hypothetical protein